MRRILLIPVLVIQCISCNNDQSSTKYITKYPSYYMSGTYYFQRSYGLEHKDTDAVLIHFKANNVWGEIYSLPYKGQWKVGKLSGYILHPYIFTANVYTTIMTGKGDTTHISNRKRDTTFVAFKLSPTLLLQKDKNFNYESSLEYFNQTKDYSIKYYPIDSTAFPKKDFYIDACGIPDLRRNELFH